MNGPEPIGLLKKPVEFTCAAGAMGTIAMLASSVPTGALVLICTVVASSAAIVSTWANCGASAPLRAMTRSTDAFTSAGVTLLPSWNFASRRVNDHVVGSGFFHSVASAATRFPFVGSRLTRGSMTC